MKAKFNVIEDKFIPVMYKDGELTEISIREVFEDAHNIRDIATNNVFEKGGLYSFLVTFCMDMYYLERVLDIRKLYEQGKFDLNLFNEYVETCEKERHGCFDLFDEKNPFMQVRGIHNKKLVSQITYDIPSGDNALIYCDIEKAINPKLTYAECTRAVLSISKFLPSKGGSSYSSGVNGDSPYYFFIRGNNLFETIVLNTVSEDSIPSGMDYGRGEVVWRRVNYIYDKEVEYLSLLEGLTYLGRFIELIPNDDEETVTNINYKPGPKFEGQYPVWRDPLVAIVKNKKGEFVPLRPKDDEKAMWRESGVFIKTTLEDGCPIPIRRLGDITDYEGNFQIVSFSGYNPGAGGAYAIWKEEILEIPYMIIKDEDKRDMYCELVNMVNVVGDLIQSKLVNINKTYYYNEVYKRLKSSLVVDIYEWDKTNLDIYNKIYLDWKNFLYGLAKETYEESFKRKDVLNSKGDNKSSRKSGYVGYAEEYYNMCNKIRKLINLN